MKNIYYLISVLVFLLGASNASAQICDPTVPVFTIDLTGNPDSIWTSPSIGRVGQCCSSGGSDKCVEFVITLDSAANGISFDIIAGAVPGGALFYQVNCGPPSALGTPVCLSGVGPHYITFCKPGNNSNVYQIQSIPEPSAGGTEYVSQACTGFLAAYGLAESSISYTSIPFNALYNSYLSCTNGCDTSIVTPIGIAPAYVDYQVCGLVAGFCDTIPFCDTIRINFVNTLAVNITPQNPTICFGGANAVVTAVPSGGLAPYTYLWSTGATTQSISVAAGTYTVQLTDAMNCSVQYDTVIVNAFSLPIAANAGPDQLLCNGAATSIALNGVITAASGGMWYNGAGTFSPNDTTMNAVYTPSASEITAGSASLMLVTTGNQGCPADTDYISITIAPQPSPVVSGNGNVCQFSSQLYTASNPNPVTYTWSVAGGSITNNFGDSILVTWNTLGAGSVTVVVANSAGCDSTLLLPVTVQPQPAPIMSGTSFACTPFTAVYHVTNAMNDNVAWVVTGGTVSGTSSADSLVVQWSTAGTGTVSVTETNSLGCDSTVSMMVDLSSTPVTSISGLPNMCGALQATYTAAASNAISHSWTVTGGSILNNNGTSIDVQWTNIGTNTITLTATNADGCDTTLSYSVDIYPQPSPTISGASQVCTPAGSVYHISNPIGNSYNWTALGGTIIGAANTDSVSVYWGAAGSGLVSVTETNSFGCDSTIAFLVDLSSTPVTSISGLPNMCGALQATYTAAASNAITHSWTVTGGSIVNNNGSSIDVQWSNIGTNTITLTATNADGCDTTISYSVDIYPQPSPSITGASQVCTPAGMVYHISNPNGNTYNWTVLGGTIIGAANSDSVSVYWGAAGSGLVSVTETNSNGCDSSIAFLVDLSATPVTSISGLPNMCGALQATYTAAASNAITHSWTVTGGSIMNNYGSSIDVQWTNIGTNTITLTATNPDGCDTTLSYTVDVYPQPSPSITGASQVCTPAGMFYHISNPIGNTYNWTVLGGTIIGAANSDSVSVYWGAAGSGLVSVTETNSNGCDSSIAFLVDLSATPVTSISGLQNICGALQATYTAAASNAVTHNWTVNGGTIVNNNDSSIDVQWTNIGTNSITLTATNADGCDTILTYSVNIYPQPIPTISGAALVCTPATSVYHAVNPTSNSYNWTVLGGTIIGASNADSVIVSWNAAGAGLVSLNEANSFGCDSVVAMIVTLSATPVTSIAGMQTVCGQETMTYSAAPSNAVSFNWTVNGGTILQSNGDSVLVSWTGSVSGSVTLTATNAMGCDTTIVYPVNLYPQPAPVLNGPIALCLPASSTYRVSSPGVNDFTWMVTEGTILGSVNADSIQVQWNNITGTGTVTVRAANAYGCDSTITMSVALSVTPSPFISGQQSFCGPSASLYTSSASNASVYNWTVNGGSVLSNNGDSIFVNWNTIGTGSITLTAVNPEGCDTTLYYTANVYPQPSPSIAGPASSCTPSSQLYTLTSATGTTFSWTGLGGTIIGSSTNDSVMVNWNAVGTGNIFVTETNSYGCDTTVQMIVDLTPYPMPNITGSDFLCKEDTATYSVAAVQGHTYNWSVTGGAIISFTVTNSIDVYWYNPGAGRVALTQVSQEGCAAQDSQQVNVNAPPSPAITGLPSACLNDNASYFTSQNAGSNYAWQLNGGTFNGSYTQSTTSVNWTTAGYAQLIVTETDINGCSASAQTQVFVNPLPVASIFGSQVGCSDPWGSAYSTNPQNNVVYQWSANGGTISGSNGQQNVNVLWNSTGITLVNLLTLNTTTGCRSTTSLQVLVDSMPQIQVTSNNFTGCAPLNAVLGSSPQSTSYSYQWWFGDGSSSFDPVASHTFNIPGNYNITLVASNNSGCKDTVQAVVVVYNSPIADFDLNVSDDFYPDDESVFSLQNNSTGGMQYLWSFGDGYTTTAFEPSYHYDGAGSYNVMLIVSNSYGCRDSMLQAVEIRVPESIYIPNAFTPNGDSNNDGFSVYAQNITEFKVSIFDRWGEEIFSSKDKDFVWDGTYFGHRVQEGVYVYKIAAVGFHGQRFEKVGTVSVLR